LITGLGYNTNKLQNTTNNENSKSPTIAKVK